MFLLFRVNDQVHRYTDSNQVEKLIIPKSFSDLAMSRAQKTHAKSFMLLS